MKKRPSDEIRKRLIDLGLVSYQYQPESRFVPNGRKLKRVAEECDPWQVVIMNSEYDIMGYALGATLDEATEAAMDSPRFRKLMGGLSGKLAYLEEAVDHLIGVMRTGDIPF